MKLRSPFYLENLFRDQPYASLLLIAPDCFNHCIGCHNQHLKEATTEDFSVVQLVEIYKSNPFVQGITLGGLEPGHCTEDWYAELLEFIEKAGIERVTVYTSLDEPFIQLPCKETYWKTGKYFEGLPKKTVQLGKFSIELASANQRFFIA